MVIKINSLFSILILFSFVCAQDAAEGQNSESDTTIKDVPSGLESGYKGFAWGSPSGTQITTSLTVIPNEDSLAAQQSFSGSLGQDTVRVTYTFADSGFWKVEIDIIIVQNDIEAQIADFRRLEKNISEVYGPPQKMNQNESGPSGSYANILEQKFTRAFYRSTWSMTPAIIELVLNSSVLLPTTDLPIFSGNFSILKLVYYNPDYMHSSQPVPEVEELPSIFDIY
ncbi:MAG: hypothetical protein U9N31_10675 [Candidatus Marinimicrobia bacterium]|nr:hypothetical protein [Candidatus Neomarinimicrobiota bacterium]